MKPQRIAVLVIAYVLLAIKASTAQVNFAPEEAVPGRMVVEFAPAVIQLAPGVTEAPVRQSSVLRSDVLQAFQSIGATRIEKLFKAAVPGQTEILSPITGKLAHIKDLSQVFVVTFDPSVPLDSALSRFANLPGVKYAAPSLYPMLDAEPNDQHFGKQWYLKNTVNPKFDIDAVPAWDVGKGDNVVIAIVDAHGVACWHEDLAPHLWAGPGNECNDVGNHGTYVAGIAVAATHNSIGVAGIGWNSKLMPRQGHYAEDLAADIEDAARNGAHIINNSWHSEPHNYDPPYLRDAVRNAFNLGAVITGSMGNESTRSDVFYPAGYDAFVVACGALKKVNNGDTLYVRDDQNWGSFIDVTAPGDSNFTTSRVAWDPNLGYYWWFGATSASTPVVSGVAALLRGANPSLSNSEIMKILKQSATLFSGWDQYPNAYGSGMVNAHQALFLDLAYANKSVSAEATAYNGGRRMIRDGDNRYHLVFESGGEVCYRRSNVGGTSWEEPKRLTSGNGSNKFPSITGTSSKQFVVWQRYAGLVSGQHKYDIYFAKNTASGWTVSVPRSESFATPTDPLPVVSYKQSQRVLLCFRNSGGIKSSYSDNDGVSWSDDSPPLDIGSGYRNPSLSMGPTTPSAWVHATYDNGSTVYFNRYDTQWRSRENVSGGTGLSQNQYASIERDSSTNPNSHVAWQAYGSAQGDTGIAYRMRYANGSWIPSFSFFYQTDKRYLQPSVTGHSGTKRSIVWYTNESKVYYNTGTGSGSSFWVADNGKYPNLSAGSTTAKFCWTSGTTSPYEIKISTQTLQRPLLLAGPAVAEAQTSSEQFLSFEHSPSAVLHDTLTNAVFWAQLGEVRVKSKGGEEILIPVVSYVDSLLALTPENHFGYVRTEAVTIPFDADSLVFDHIVYSRGSDALKLSGATNPEVEYKLVDATSNLSLMSVGKVAVVEKAGEFRSQEKVAVSVEQYRGRKIFIAVEARGLGKENPHLLRSLGEIYRVVEAPSFKRDPQVGQGAQTLPLTFALEQNYPNPFNPETAIRYQLPQDSHVTLKIYNLLGQEVRTLVDKEEAAGYHAVHWDGKDTQGRNLASGIYMYRIEAGPFVSSKKLALIR